ncbi:ABC transporter permease subunit [Marivirga sp. S37H4]|uniref:ABC transporter permease subunit n=1 Tax=Marivirga aurantiaca TaxID=2802615 RepID=A0A934WW73_9BACT|nr:ABC transporter permease subunit [Marivirga aurantiaca]MBK6264109.1 ABC transporter permease subunit [Marivirga aurantiaca]
MRNKFSHIGLVFFVLIGVIPFAAAFIYALLYSLGIVGVLNSGFTLQHWQTVLASSEVFKSFGYSALVAAISVVISVSFALWLALKFRKEFDQKILSFIIYLPLAIPGVVAAFFTFQLFSRAGFFSRLAYQLGWINEVSQFPDLVNDALATGIIITFITIVMPFFVLLFLNVYKNERVGNLSELAYSLGASSKQVLWRVSLPVILRKTWTLIALYFIFLLGAYEIPLLLGQESPQMLSVLIIREIKQFDLSKISEGYAIAIIYTIVVSVAVSALFSRKNKTLNEI